MGEMTLEEAVKEYKSVYMAYRNFAERTRIEYQNDLDDLVGYLEKFGVKKAGEQKLGQIERYLANLENRGYAGATRKRKTVAIRSFLSFLYKDGYISSNIAKHIIPPFVVAKLPAFLTEPEYNRLRNTCAGNIRDAAIIELLLQTGIRLSELTRLTLDDVEFSGAGGFIRITANRGREERLLSLNSDVCTKLKNYLKKWMNSDNSSLFLNRFGKPLGDRGVQKMLQKYLKAAGLEKVSIHTLRHTFAIRYFKNGVKPEAIHKIMGIERRALDIYNTIINIAY